MDYPCLAPRHRLAHRRHLRHRVIRRCAVCRQRHTCTMSPAFMSLHFPVNNYSVFSVWESLYDTSLQKVIKLLNIEGFTSEDVFIPI